MIGANAIFHLASLVATIWMVVLLMRWRSDRDLLRQLTAAGATRTFFLREPGKLLAQLCRAQGLPFEAEGGVGKLRKITWAPLREFFSSQQVTLVRWNEGHIKVQIAGQLAGSQQWEDRLKTAVGEDISVAIESVQE